MGLTRDIWRGAAICVALAMAPSRVLAYRTLQDDPALELSSAATFSDSPTWELYPDALDTSRWVDLEQAALGAFDTWGGPSCTSFAGNYRGLSSTPAARGDGRSTVSVVSAGWSALGLPSGKGATTDVQITRDATGHAVIVEADVYLNMDQNRFSFEGVPTSGELDLRGVLTHEIGHLLGLLHPCEHSSADAPECATAEASTCMYPDYTGTSQRALGADDIAGVCALYPSSSAPCSPSCAAGQTCVDGACQASCPSCVCDGGMAADGGCVSNVVQCVEDDQCGTGMCIRWGGRRGTCAPASTLGTVCEHGVDCASGLCARSVNLGYAVCTRRCDVDAECESGAACTTIGADRVCMPEVTPSPSCHVIAGLRGARSSSRYSLLALLPLLALARRRQRRTNHAL